jgi:hypothetical protein
MPKLLFEDRFCGPGVLWLLAAGAALCAIASHAQAGVPDAPRPTRPTRPLALPDRIPDKPSLPPVFTIPVEPLGFTSPGPLYLGQRNSIVSLDFLDENRLLFTFRVPGLIHREGTAKDDGGERQIRAVVLALPAGTVEPEALWTVHDRARYLWMLKDGHFLFRDRDDLQLGDPALALKPFLHFPGPLLSLEMNPGQQLLVANSSEPAASPQKPGDVPTPPTAAAKITVDGQTPGDPLDRVVRILRRDSGKVMLVSRVRSTVHLPINADGYLEALRGKGMDWLLNLNFFSGGSKILGKIESSCAPLLDFLSEREVMATACAPSGDGRLIALTTEGRRLWEDQTSPTAIWPLLIKSPDGSRLAREALSVSRAIDARSPIDREDIKGQLVEVLDAADGKVALETQANPVLDAGGNVAISPSGRRVAVLNAGAIQVFELPPPELPEPPSNQSRH